uniref:NADH dehydrogenase subunit 2 n=1 Tax=Nomada fabriciana TaxID=601510 RepID=A0A0S2LUB5_9HYME|nr:NADH dehydrogenase subunit 2 [Nomada fabriciana]
MFFLKKICILFMFIMFIFIQLISDILLKWLLIEISTILFIYYINFKSSNKIISIYYFSISMISSIFMIFLLIMYFNFMIINNLMFNLILQLNLFLKIGIFPFSFLLIYIYNKLNWNEIFIMSTLMKFLPSIFFIELINLNKYLIYILLFNSIIISLISLNYYSIKKIIACSSINQSLMMILMLYINKKMFLFYMIMYMLLLFMLIYMFNLMNINNKFNLIKIFQFNKLNLIYSLIIFMYSMLPPFTSMMIKWMFFFEILNQYINFMYMIFIMSFSMILMTWNYFNLSKYLIYNNFLMKKIYLNKFFNLLIFMLMISLNLFMIFLFNLY